MSDDDELVVVHYDWSKDDVGEPPLLTLADFEEVEAKYFPVRKLTDRLGLAFDALNPFTMSLGRNALPIYFITDFDEPVVMAAELWKWLHGKTKTQRKALKNIMEQTRRTAN